MRWCFALYTFRVRLFVPVPRGCGVRVTCGHIAAHLLICGFADLQVGRLTMREGFKRLHHRYDRHIIGKTCNRADFLP